MPKGGGPLPQAQNPALAALQARFEQGLALHRQGKLAEAERVYGEVLQRQPNHFIALQLLGVIAVQTRRTMRGVELIKKAIALNAKVPGAHYNLANALRDLNRPEEALASYDKAIALQPGFAEAFSNRGNALWSLNRREEALASYDKAIALKPDSAEAHINRGNALRNLDRPAEALASYEKAISLKPDAAEAHNNRGNVLRSLGRSKEALASYD
jgi:protein O-GlcNAc transferase